MVSFIKRSFTDVYCTVECHVKCKLMVLRPQKLWKSCRQNHGNFVRIAWIISRKFPLENTIFLKVRYSCRSDSDSAHLFKVFGWFQIFLHSFCVEKFWSHGTEHVKIALLHGRLQLNCWNWVWDYHIAYYAKSQQQSDFRTCFKLIYATKRRGPKIC